MEIRNKISGKDFYEMRCSVSWKEATVDQLEKAIEKSMIVVGIYEDNKIAAMGRLVGDYTFKALLTDIIVKPEYQGNGYGKIIVSKILEIAKENIKIGEILCIEGTPTKGNLEFYKKCGFKYTPEIQDGIYLWLEK